MIEGGFDSSVSVGDIMDRWPQTIPVFIKYQMGCVGCCMAKFETLEDAMQIYHAPKDEFLREINRVIKGKKQ